MTEPVLSVQSLRKSYGDIQALRDVSFEVAPGEIFGLVGPNGAGKSTTLRVVATLLTADSG
ncbi:MAG: ABC-2 type transport system ATP-binding protein, partial [Natronomonas sp.]